MTRGGRWVMWTVVGVGALCASSVYRRPFATLRSINRRLLLLTGVAERTASVHGVPMRYFEAGGPAGRATRRSCWYAVSAIPQSRGAGDSSAVARPPRACA
ncbi:MAG: hypothetical protein WKH64_04810 [Chloroflexia bacterium]